jgi:signal peptidase I
MASGKILRDYALTVGVAVGLAWIVRNTLIEAYRIPTQSMSPTLEPGDTIFVSKWGFGWLDPPIAHGDIVIYSRPEEPGRESIKRVVALAGEKFELKAGNLWINDRPASSEKTEETQPTPTESSGSQCSTEKVALKDFGTCRGSPLPENAGPVTVPPGSLIVMADYRVQPEGLKAQVWYLVPQSSLSGRALWIWMSFRDNRIRLERMFKRL